MTCSQLVECGRSDALWFGARTTGLGKFSEGATGKKSGYPENTMLEKFPEEPFSNNPAEGAGQVQDDAILDPTGP